MTRFVCNCGRWLSTGSGQNCPVCSEQIHSDRVNGVPVAGGHAVEVLGEIDPNGKSPHEAGSKLDAGKNRLGLVLGGFTLALQEVGRVGTYGAEKYTPDGWRSVPDGLNRYTDAMYRHLLAEAAGEHADADTGIAHAAHAAWNALARLHFLLEGEQ